MSEVTIEALQSLVLKQASEIQNLKATLLTQQETITSLLTGKDDIKRALASITTLESRISVCEKAPGKGTKSTKGGNGAAKAPGNTHQRWCGMWRDDYEGMLCIVKKYSLLSNADLKPVIAKVNSAPKAKSGSDKSSKYQVGKGTWGSLSDESKEIWKGFCAKYDELVQDGQEDIVLKNVDYTPKTTGKSNKKGGKTDLNDSIFLKGLSDSDDDDNDESAEEKSDEGATITKAHKSSGSDTDDDDIVGKEPKKAISKKEASSPKGKGGKGGKSK